MVLGAGGAQKYKSQEGKMVHPCYGLAAQWLCLKGLGQEVQDQQQHKRTQENCVGQAYITSFFY